MVTLTIPFRRTVMIPAGSPGIAAVTKVEMELKNWVSGTQEDWFWCKGEADLLVDYTAAGESENPFAFQIAQRYAGEPWQFLTTLPMEFRLPKQNIPENVCFSLGFYHGYKVALNGLELEGELILAQEEQKRDIPFAQGGQPKQETPLSWQQPCVEQYPKRKRESGGWTLVSLNQDNQEKEQTVEMIHRLVEEADQTVADANALWQRIDQEHAEAPGSVLTTEEMQQEPEEMVRIAEEMTAAPVTQEREDTEAPQAETLAESISTSEKENLWSATLMEEMPEPTGIISRRGEEASRAIAEESAEQVYAGESIIQRPTAEAEPMAAKMQTKEKAEGPVVKTQYEKGAPDPICIKVEFQKPASVEDVVFPSSTESQGKLSAVEKTMAQPEESDQSAEQNAEEASLVAAAASETDAAASEVEAVTAEVLPPEEEAEEAMAKPKGKRRRIAGLPCFVVDAKDNNVEISAFNLQIKL